MSDEDINLLSSKLATLIEWKFFRCTEDCKRKQTTEEAIRELLKNFFEESK